MTLATVILVVTATTTALIAGLFYAYSCSVNPGLAQLSDAGYLAAMQSINKAILNPLFFVSFMGTLLLLPVSAYLHYGQPLSNRFLFLAIAAVFYIIGVFGVTVLGNIPLNEALAQFDLNSASANEITAQRVKFEQPWNKWHSVRTIASVLCIISVIVACLSESSISKAGENA